MTQWRRAWRDQSAALGCIAAMVLVLVGCECTPLGSVDCGGIYDGACTAQGDAIAARWPCRVKSIELRCELPVCDRRLGAGRALVVFDDGSTTQTAWRYENNEPALPEASCEGLDPEVCRLVYANVAWSLDPGVLLSAVTIHCDGSCERSQGETTVTLTLADGSTQKQPFGWTGGLTMPPPGGGVEVP